MFADSGQPLAFILPPENSMSTAHFSDSTEKAMKIRATFFLFQTHSPNGNELRIFNCLGFGSLFFFFIFILFIATAGWASGWQWAVWCCGWSRRRSLTFCLLGFCSASCSLQNAAYVILLFILVCIFIWAGKFRFSLI